MKRLLQEQTTAAPMVLQLKYMSKNNFDNMKE